MGDRFRERVRPFTMPDTKIFRPADRIRWASHWKKEFEELEALVKENGLVGIGETDLRNWKRMQKFYLEVGEMLGQIADTLQAQEFDRFAAAAVQEVIDEANS